MSKRVRACCWALVALTCVGTVDRGQRALPDQPLAPLREGVLASAYAISTLHPSAQARAKALLSAAHERGIALVVTSGFRSPEEQERSYEQGRTSPGLVVTHVRAGQSWHNYGLAFDVAIADERGKLTWPEDRELWREIGELGERVGLLWGGRFPMPDRPHFELRGGLSIRDVQRGARPTASSGERPDA